MTHAATTLLSYLHNSQCLAAWCAQNCDAPLRHDVIDAGLFLLECQDPRSAAC
jgi:hypothetical protein